MARQFSAVCLANATTNRRSKLRFLLDQPQSCFPHQLLSVGTAAVRYPGKLRFLLGCEVYFHHADCNLYRSQGSPLPRIANPSGVCRTAVVDPTTQGAKTIDKGYEL
jgi:hypothetical protein